MEEKRSWNRGSIVFPVILIAIGLIVLLSNLGVIEGNAWDFFVLFWPVLLIAFGLDGILKREGIVAPVFLIGLGVVFLLSNLGYLVFDVWQTILRLWPVLLIAFGIDIVIGRRSTLWSIVGLVVALAVLAGALWAAGLHWRGGEELSSEGVSQSLEGASAARLVIKPAAGELRIAAMPGLTNLVEGTIHTRRNERVTEEFSLEGDTAVYSIQGSGVMFVGPVRTNERWGWDLSLAPSIPIDLETGMGAGKTEIDLTNLTLTELNVSMGVGETTVILPESGQFQGEIDGAIGQITILLPQNMELAVDANTALGSLNVPDDFIREGERYTSPGYAAAQDRIDLEVGQAIGSINIRRR
jgi:hypothetical protein